LELTRAFVLKAFKAAANVLSVSSTLGNSSCKTSLEEQQLGFFCLLLMVWEVLYAVGAHAMP
jgi:hypothetical protein